MGGGIAQVFAQKGFTVTLYDVNGQTLEAAKKRIEKYAPGVSGKINFTDSVDDCIAGFIIEAIVENIPAKTKLFKELIRINGPETIFATNTSSLSVKELAEKSGAPERFAGLHFFNPAPLMRLVEIVNTPYLANDTLKFLSRLVESVGKTAVICNDSPGFIVNRVARPYYLEALYLLEQNVSEIGTIDELMEASGFKMGPFKLMDLIGNDINFSVSCIVHEALGKPLRLKPSPIQQNKVGEGALGRKTGKGYYEYPVT